jgi:hypothetical protein
MPYHDQLDNPESTGLDGSKVGLHSRLIDLEIEGATLKRDMPPVIILKHQRHVDQKKDD